ncbi:hypothetical protein H6G81_22745 [Scytonema hofmannii FACHB-248]|uniref:Transposase n=1 Tax=Scytonema hofmannii FACHB-248 TaxID=1842502 RepID=A0ABR8GVT5_9CYAN|nr:MULTISPECIES: hypothetical protein [Nostocales]MBD2607268.1 hypothetical protein [Scytonema hofmannii FACHB-248]
MATNNRRFVPLRLEAWGYTNKACLRRLKAFITNIQAIATNVKAVVTNALTFVTNNKLWLLTLKRS